MELENQTPYPALLYRFIIDADRLGASVFSRVTYDVVDGNLVVSKEQAWPVSPGEWECDYGPMESDCVFYRGGVDFFVFGKARPVGGREAAQVEVSVTVGNAFRYNLMVIGDRVWTKTRGTLAPSAPKPFVEMPLTLPHAYGGKDVWDEIEIMFPDNPLGKGYAYDAETAEGKPLPNLENPAKLIKDWSDRPDPVSTGACPLPFGPRLSNSTEIANPPTRIGKIHPTIFNSAFPGLIVKEVRPGDQCAITGVSAAGPFRFRLPAVPLQTRVSLGEKVVEKPLVIDQIGVEPDKKRVFVSYRYHFRYKMIPLQLRTCELYAVKS